ncbi:hypothetical protein [Nostoc sp. MS1]|uniref:hypothetical protein n=1 Tax=Nostoc sp. MS1 TaxID=2764711 RepID=UPI001CC6CCA1|nr:hypothetical protein [Nostoc sp. MS1]BCL38191.1 hypothetical protein NSMS1_46380 [Nostoc sp. MS1]
MSIEILDTLNNPAIQKFRNEIISKRSIGNIVFELKQISPEINIDKSEDLQAILDLFVTQLGYVGLGVHWKEINQNAAEKILERILTKDLAYSAKIMSTGKAEEISTKMLNFFQNPCKFFTNAVFTDNYSAMSAWDSLTESTFDTGVIIVSTKMIGILWVKDED